MTVCITAVLLAGCRASSPTGPSYPNVILISIDTLRADHLGSYGYVKETSPALDRLAASGARFASVVTQSTITGLAHQAALSGLLPGSSRPESGAVTLAEHLRNAGFETAAFVDGAYMSAIYGHDAGFDSYVDDLATPAPEGGRPVADQKDGGFAAVLPAARRWLEARDGARPFFLFLHTYDVHCPYTPPAEYASLFTDVEGDQAPIDLGGKCDKDFTGTLSDPVLAYIRSQYDAGIRYADDRLGDFLEDARKDGLLENTLVVVISDHGESLGERRHVGHSRLHVAQMFVPWIMSGPGVPSGKIVNHPAQLIDLVPTVLDYLGLPPPGVTDGISLMPAVMGDDDGSRERLRVCQVAWGRALILGPWVLEQRKKGLLDLLYHLDRDPEASDNRLPGEEATRDRILQAWADQAAHRGGPADGPGLEGDETVEPDEGTLEKLRSLGYID